jgi:hypothetical protein
MRRVWKWVLGIVLVLVLCAAAGGIFFALNGRYLAQVAPITQAEQRRNDAWSMPMHRGFDGPIAPYWQRGFGQGMYPHMGISSGHGFMPFGGGFMLLGGLVRLFIPLVIFGLVAFLAYQLGKQTGARAATSPAATPPPAAPEATEKGGEESPQ